MNKKMKAIAALGLAFVVSLGAAGSLRPGQAAAEPNATLQVTASEDVLISGGVLWNDYFLRTGPAPQNRMSYLKFDVGGLTHNVTSAKLKLTTVDGVAAGDPKLRVYEGLTTDWTESTFNAVNPPAKGALLASHGQSVMQYDSVLLDVGGLIDNNGTYTIILQGGEVPGDNAVVQSFGSSEHQNPAYRAQLIIETGDEELVEGEGPGGGGPGGDPVELPEGCDFFVPADSSWFWDGSAAGPGDVVCLEGGERPETLRIDNVHGAEGSPVTIVNYGGPVTLATDPANAAYNNQYALKIASSSFFRLTGTGDPASPYGIRLSANNAGATALQIILGSTDYEVDHLEIYDMPNGYAGMTLFTQPTCDPATQRGGFVQRNTHIHDNLVADTGGEGMYIGHSYYYNGYNATCNGQSVKLWPHPLEGVSIHHNTIKDTGWDGLQLGAATQDVEVHHNAIENYGTANTQYQQNGLQINPGTTGEFYGNRIVGGTGMGVQNQGRDGVRLYNNLIVNPAMDGIISSELVNPNDPVFGNDAIHILNNTIINPGGTGVSFWNTATADNLLQNNLIVNEDATDDADYLALQFPGQSDATVSHNRYANSLAAAGFVNAAGGNYKLLGTSAAVDAGADLTAVGLVDDLDGKARPDGGGYDIGAYESEFDAALEARFIMKEAVVNGVTRKYAVYVPEAYDASVPWPMIVFHHGAGETGLDGVKQSKVGIGKAIRDNPELYNAIVVMPQHRNNQGIDPVAEIAIRQTAAEYNVDPTRWYLTGLSAGGYVSWTIGANEANRYAALMPIAGGGDESKAAQLAQIPIWAFHGELDNVVPVSETRKMIQPIQAAGGDIRYTEFPGVLHNSWDLVYPVQEYADWLMAQRNPDAYTLQASATGLQLAAGGQTNVTLQFRKGTFPTTDYYFQGTKTVKVSGYANPGPGASASAGTFAGQPLTGTSTTVQLAFANGGQATAALRLDLIGAQQLQFEIDGVVLSVSNALSFEVAPTLDSLEALLERHATAGDVRQPLLALLRTSLAAAEKLEARNKPLLAALEIRKFVLYLDAIRHKPFAKPAARAALKAHAEALIAEMKS